MKGWRRTPSDRLFASNASGATLRRELRAGHWQAWTERALVAAAPAERLAWERGSPLTERCLLRVWPAGAPAPQSALLARGRDGGIWLELRYAADVELASAVEDFLDAARQRAGEAPPPVIHAVPEASSHAASPPRPAAAALERSPSSPAPLAVAPERAPTSRVTHDPASAGQDALLLEDVAWLNPGDPVQSSRRGLCRVVRIPRPGEPVRLRDASGRDFDVAPAELCAEFRHALED